MRLVTKADAGQWLKASTAYERIIAKAATLAMRDVGKDAVTKGRAAISAAGFSPKFAGTLRVINKPASGYVLNPAAYVHSTINYADVFETGKTITGHPFIWLPLPSVPPIAGRQHMTPKQYIQNVGPLVTMRRPGRLPLLGAVVKGPPKAQPFGRFATRARLRKGRSGKGTVTQTIPLFVGVPSVNIPKKFDVKGAVDSAFGKLQEFYNQHFEPYEGRK
jgi:hypothetical protein